MENKDNNVVLVNLDELKELLRQQTGTEKQQTADSDTMEIDLFDLVRALLRRWWLIVLAALVCAAVGFVVLRSADTITTYTATGKMYVTDNASIEADDISLARLKEYVSPIDTCVEILQTRMTLNKVSARLQENGYSTTADDIASGLTVEVVNDTQFLCVTVTDTDSDRAIATVNTIMEMLPSEISSFIDDVTVRTVDSAEKTEATTTAEKTSYVIIGAFIGAALACVYIVLADCLFNDKIEGSDWLKNAYPDIPVLAEIPDGEACNRTGRYYRSTYYKNLYASAYSSKKNG